MANETYIGDAVHVSYDGFQLRLRCESPPCVIYLDQYTYSALVEFVNKLRGDGNAATG